MTITDTLTDQDPDAMLTPTVVRERLLSERAELLATLAAQRGDEPAERSDVPDGPGETENLSAAEHLEVTSRIAAITQAACEEIDAALARLDAGTYGTCHGCGADIPPARLEAIPAATHCVACQGARESAHG